MWFAVPKLFPLQRAAMTPYILLELARDVACRPVR
jgi:hypothetical protein